MCAAVKACSAQLSGPVHPDRLHQSHDAIRAVATQRYTGLNAAQQCLADTRQRLRHLTELGTGQRPTDVGAVPRQISDLSFEIGQWLKFSDEVVRRKQAMASSLVQSQDMRQMMERMHAPRCGFARLDLRRGAPDERRQKLPCFMEGRGAFAGEVARAA